MSDALTIAKWCWPEVPWIQAHGGAFAGQAMQADWRSFIIRDGALHSFHDVRAAELVVIERGLAEEYGRALWDSVKAEDCPTCCECGASHSPHWELECAALATAPLPARIRALVAVIKAQEKKA